MPINHVTLIGLGLALIAAIWIVREYRPTKVTECLICGRSPVDIGGSSDYCVECYNRKLIIYWQKEFNNGKD